MVLFVAEEDVDSVVSMDDALRAVRHAFIAQGNGRADNAPRQRITLDDALIQVMAGSVETEFAAPGAVPDPNSGWLLAKIGCSTTERRRTWSLLFDRQANLRCILQMQRLGQLRTAAATGVSADVLGRSDAAIFTCMGAGFHAFAQVEAITWLRPKLQVIVWSRTPAKSEGFAQRLRDRFGISVKVENDAGAAVAQGDIVATMTRSAEPVVHGADVRPGTHVILAGSNEPNKREADAELFRRASEVYVDSASQARIESGDLIMAAREGAIEWDALRLLGTATAEADRAPDKRRDRDPDAITVFSSQGVGMWDAAIAVAAYRNATDRRLGTRLPLDGASRSKEREP